MHQAALFGEGLHDAKKFGWSQADAKGHDWSTMATGIQNYVKSLNWGYRKRLKDDGVEYFNSYGVFSDPHTIEATDAAGNKSRLSGEYIAIAVGGRPNYPDIPGKEHLLSSDDLFWLKKPPGKTLVIGASYVALECAGFLTGLQYDTTVMNRSVFLRGFDQDMANKAVQYMRGHGTKFLDKQIPVSIRKTDTGKLQVSYVSADATQKSTPQQQIYDTVLSAIGRVPSTSVLGLAKIGVQTDPKSRKILSNEQDQTNVKHIFALGDVAYNRPELTPVAIQAGKLLARRLFESQSHSPSQHKKLLMNYNLIPTTVFTPLEYSCIGLTEEQAQQQLGNNLEVYHAYFQPLEWSVAGREDNACYVKLLADISQSRTDKSQQPVVGLHFLGPHAGEVMQGFAVALRKGASVEDFEMTIGIHPTAAEEVVKLDITKSSGLDPKKTGC
jgi:thioredoxin reductase (NADPH)